MIFIQNVKIVRFTILLIFSIDKIDFLNAKPSDCYDLITQELCTCSLYMPNRVSCFHSPDLTVGYFIQPLDTITVACFHGAAIEENLLPNVTLTDISTIGFYGCPLTSYNIMDIVNKLGIKQPTALTISPQTKNFRFTRQHFQQMHTLKWLYLKNHIKGNNTKLDADSFMDMQQLNVVQIELYNLHNLPEGIFRNQQKLIELTLSCDLQNLSSEIFKELENLDFLIIVKNKIESLPVELLKYNRKLRYFKLYDNHAVIPTLGAGFFANFNILTEITLSCGLSRISENLFSNSSALKVLGMSYNRLEELPSQMLQDQHNLSTLDLSRNRLKSLPENLFQNTKKLRYLYLGFNEFTTLSSSLLQKSAHWFAHELLIDLSFNQIGDIHFDNMPKTTMAEVQFNLRDNPINCDCNLYSFLEFIKNTKSFNTNKNVRCAKPYQLKQKKFYELTAAELLCVVELCPRGCQCWRRSMDLVLIVNCTNVGNMREVPALPSLQELKLRSLELHIEDNDLAELPVNSTTEFNNITKIYAAGNNISKIAVENLPLKLTLLDLSRNNLTVLSTKVVQHLNKSETLLELRLSDNPWGCKCELIELLNYTINHYKLITDYDRLQCRRHPNTTIRFLDISLDELCPLTNMWTTSVIVGIACGVIFIGLLAILIAIYYKYQRSVHIWLYAHKYCLFCVTEHELDRDKIYDAFVSYSHKDEHFIEQHLVPRLERESSTMPFKLCLHARDWLVGVCINEQIVRSIEDSKRTIVVLSPNFIQSVWGRLEFRIAHQAALNEKRNRVIIIMLEPIGDVDALDKDLKAYLKLNTYLVWGDESFWSKLRYAMPHVTTPTADVRENNIALQEI